MRIVDGDSIVIASTRYRIRGIDAPEIHQKCFDQNGTEYPCGRIAKRFLNKAIKTSGSSIVQCNPVGRDIYKRYLADCYVNKKNLGRYMVKYGMAIAYIKYSNQYCKEQIYAIKNKLGIWQGIFLQPSYYRKIIRKKKVISSISSARYKKLFSRMLASIHRVCKQSS